MRLQVTFRLWPIRVPCHRNVGKRRRRANWWTIAGRRWHKFVEISKGGNRKAVPYSSRCLETLASGKFSQRDIEVPFNLRCNTKGKYSVECRVRKMRSSFEHTWQILACTDWTIYRKMKTCGRNTRQMNFLLEYASTIRCCQNNFAPVAQLLKEFLGKCFGTPF